MLVCDRQLPMCINRDTQGGNREKTKYTIIKQTAQTSLITNVRFATLTSKHQQFEESWRKIPQSTREVHYFARTFDNNKTLETHNTAVHEKDITKHTLKREPSLANHKKEGITKNFYYKQACFKT